jgi:prophage antirepressor-like protein
MNMKKQAITTSVVSFLFDGRTIRAVVDKRGRYWFVGRDIGLALGFKNPNAMMTSRSKSAIAKHELIKDRMGRDQEVRVLTLAEAMEMIQRAKVPVPGFESWLIDEVCPVLNAQLSQKKPL